MRQQGGQSSYLCNVGPVTYRSFTKDGLLLDVNSQCRINDDRDLLVKISLWRWCLAQEAFKEVVILL